MLQNQVLNYQKTLESQPISKPVLDITPEPILNDSFVAPQEKLKSCFKRK